MGSAQVADPALDPIKRRNHHRLRRSFSRPMMSEMLSSAGAEGPNTGLVTALKYLTSGPEIF